MARPTIRTDKMIEEILERLAGGQTLVSIFADKKLPTNQAYGKWRVKDADLDRRTFNAQLKGYLVHADLAADAQLKVINGTMPGDHRKLQAVVTAANNLGHQALAKLSRLDARFKEKSEVSHTGPMIIGWAGDAPAVTPIPAVKDEAEKRVTVN
jgi:hypothetical protein